MPFVVLILCLVLCYIVAFVLTDDACLLLGVFLGLCPLVMLAYAILWVM